MKPRIIYYYQTFLADGLKDILYPNSPVTHIHLSAIHFGNNNTNNNKVPYIHLNDYTPDNVRFQQVWKDLKKANDLGITVVVMLGGAGGAFDYLFNDSVGKNFATCTEKTQIWNSWESSSLVA